MASQAMAEMARVTAIAMPRAPTPGCGVAIGTVTSTITRITSRTASSTGGTSSGLVPGRRLMIAQRAARERSTSSTYPGAPGGGIGGRVDAGWTPAVSTRYRTVGRRAGRGPVPSVAQVRKTA